MTAAEITKKKEHFGACCASKYLEGGNGDKKAPSDMLGGSGDPPSPKEARQYALFPLSTINLAEQPEVVSRLRGALC